MFETNIPQSRALKRMVGAGVASNPARPRHFTLDRLKLVQVDIPIENLPPVFDGYRIVNLADFHFGPALAYDTVMEAIEWTRVLAPDLIALTGDYISTYVEGDLLYGAVSQLDARDGVWAVMGNHDYWGDIIELRDVLKTAGAVELSNNNVPIQHRGQTLWLAGVDDVREQKHDLGAALCGIPEDASTIALVHEPDFADEVMKTGKVSLQLSGHSHGGHMRIPLINYPVLSKFVSMAQKYPHGLYRLGKMWLHTSAGLGWWKLPRLFASPELVEVTLHIAR